MKIVLIIGIIFVSVFGFFLFLLYISKQQTKKPIEKVKEQDKNEALFIKQRQELYKQNYSDKDVQKVDPIDEGNRGALFERAIQRKRNNFKDDDIEYQERLSKKKEEEARVLEQEKNLQKEFEPKEIPFNLITKNKEEEEQEEKEEEELKEEKIHEEVKGENNVNEKLEEKEEEAHVLEQENKTLEEEGWEEEPKKEKDKKEGEDNIQEAPEEVINLTTEEQTIPKPLGRIFRNEKFNDVSPSTEEESLRERRNKVEDYEKKKQQEILRFREEILLEAENIRRRRKELATAANAVS